MRTFIKRENRVRKFHQNMPKSRFFLFILWLETKWKLLHYAMMVSENFSFLNQ